MLFLKSVKCLVLPLCQHCFFLSFCLPLFFLTSFLLFLLKFSLFPSSLFNIYYCLKFGLRLFLKSMISREEIYFIMFFSLALENCFFEITQNFKFLAKTLQNFKYLQKSSDHELMILNFCTVHTHPVYSVYSCIACFVKRDKSGEGRLGLWLFPFSWGELLLCTGDQHYIP